jgi:23S rRNA (cytidine1920-2'-O)/16S rRNA (cytidine1409-2'-O)-methyltransferase
LARRSRARLRTLREELARRYPEIDDPEELIRSGDVLVHGIVSTNPASLVPPGTPIALRQARVLRGEAKLRAALATFAVPVRGRVALDVGAAAGGFTRILLEAGARRVYAVDAGHGQLLGSLRQDGRVVTWSARTRRAGRPGRAGQRRRGDARRVVPRAGRGRVAARPRREPACGAIALVKPQFELGLARPPTDVDVLRQAVDRATHGFGEAGWDVKEAMASPVPGARGAVEFLLHAVRGIRRDRP